uniref:Phosphatidate cytidylyltransferase n=1 Tax=Romanomermis culicivorax TaxID=13658 RepID=A0A915I2G7_ROMCU
MALFYCSGTYSFDPEDQIGHLPIVFYLLCTIFVIGINDTLHRLKSRTPGRLFNVVAKAGIGSVPARHAFGYWFGFGTTIVPDILS